jgi:hypothetical protein
MSIKRKSAARKMWALAGRVLEVESLDFSGKQSITRGFVRI